MLKLISNMMKYQTAIRALVGVNVVTTVSSTRFGWLWWLFNPLITMMIYYFFVGILLGRGGENYHLFVLTGIIAWQMFAVSISGSMTSINRNKQLIQQVALPIEILVMIPIFVQLFFGAVGLLIVVCFTLKNIGVHTFVSIIYLLYIGMAAYAIGLFLSIINIYISDTKRIIEYILRAGFFLSPILFPVTRITENPHIPEIAKIIMIANPMAHIIPQLRGILLFGNGVDWTEIAIIGILLLVFIQLGLLWVRKNFKNIIKML